MGSPFSLVVLLWVILLVWFGGFIMGNPFSLVVLLWVILLVWWFYYG